jgi:hypothetical protein
MEDLDRAVGEAEASLGDEVVAIGVVLLADEVHPLPLPAERLEDGARPEVAAGALEQIAVQDAEHRVLPPGLRSFRGETPGRCPARTLLTGHVFTIATMMIMVHHSGGGVAGANEE